MECQKCNKEMDRDDGGATLKGIEVRVEVEPSQDTEGNIAYRNLQLGKYSNGKGESHIAICYECYIDSLFNTGRRCK